MPDGELSTASFARDRGPRSEHPRIRGGVQKRLQTLKGKHTFIEYFLEEKRRRSRGIAIFEFDRSQIAYVPDDGTGTPYLSVWVPAPGGGELFYVVYDPDLDEIMKYQHVSMIFSFELYTARYRQGGNSILYFKLKRERRGTLTNRTHRLHGSKVQFVRDYDLTECQWDIPGGAGVLEIQRAPYTQMGGR